MQAGGEQNNIDILAIDNLSILFYSGFIAAGFQDLAFLGEEAGL
jgi:hypothetical protein